MSGTPLEQFTTFMESQGPAWATGPEVLINEGVKNKYTWARLARGKDMQDMVQGGDRIEDRIFFDVVSTYERVNPGYTVQQYDNPQTGTNWNAPWTFARAYMTWNDKERGLNNQSFTGSYRRQMFKSLMFQKHQNLWTDVVNSVDAEFWSQPNHDLMESAAPTGPRIPYSVPVFINEMSDASGTQGTGVDGLPDATAGNGGWTTVMGINPTTQVKWQNERELYTFDGSLAGGTAGAVNIFHAFSRLMYRLEFDRLPMKPEYSDKKTSPHVILSQMQGVVNYEHALRVNQDFFRGTWGKQTGQDPDYDKPTFRNIPLDWVSELDTALIYPTGASDAFSVWSDTANTVANGIGAAGPRYYFFNGEYMKLIFHSENYAKLSPPFMPSNQPDSRVQICEVWNQLYAKSRRRHGIAAPSADTVDAA